MAHGSTEDPRHGRDEQLRLLEACIAHLHDIVLITEAEPLDEPGPRILYVNEAFVRVTGYRAAEALGRSPRFLQGPRTQRDALDRIRDALRGRRHVREELINYGKTGAELWLEIDVMPIHDPGGRCTHFVAIQRDITERKQAEEDLRRAESSLLLSERRFRQLAESMPMIVWIAEPDGRVCYSNRVFFEYTGVSEQAPPETRWQGRLHPDDLGRCIATWERAVSTGQPYSIEYRLRRADGEYRWFHVQATPIRDDFGAIVRWYGTGIDIHDSRRLREEAEQLARRLTTILESLSDAFFVLDREGRVTDANAQAGRLLGREPARLLGCRPWEEQPAPPARALEDLCRRALAGGRPLSGRIQAPERGRWLEVAAHPSHLGLAVFVRDVTERHEARERLRISEERFRLLARATNDAIWDWDIRDDRLWWNEGFEALFGYSRGEVPVTLASWSDLIHPEDRERVLTGLQAVLAGGGEAWKDEYRFLRRDGSQATVLDRGHVLRNAQGQPVRMIGGMTDVTERKRTEGQLLRAQRMESIGTLAGGIAHDLNNLLAPILLGTSLLRKQGGSEKTAMILANIESSARRGAELVRQVLSFARGIEGARSSIRLADVVREIELMVRNSFPKTIEFVADLPIDLWPVQADATQINQVLMNLCVNARDAMEAGGTITLRGSNVELQADDVALPKGQVAGRHVRLEVADTGSGIPAELIERIFDPFFTTKELGKGTGLGLATVLGIVRSHGGWVTVYSEPNKGSVFKVFLPAAPPRSEGVQTARPSEELPRGQGETILLVDDEAAILAVTRTMLESCGYKVLTAEDGARGIETFVLNRGRIAVVVTDMMMPVMDGPALIAALRRIDATVPVVAASGLESNGNAARAASLGVRSFLSKPYSASDMLVALEAVLRGSPTVSR